jgi:hypothetical protein
MSSYHEDGLDAPLSRERADLGATAVVPPPHVTAQPQPQPYGYGYGPQPWAMRPRRQYPIETKPFFLTSEFAAAALAVAGIAITAASSDAFGAWRAWMLITGIVAAYLLSRGIAKSGTRSNASDPREQLDLDGVGAAAATTASSPPTAGRPDPAPHRRPGAALAYRGAAPRRQRALL